MNRCLLHKNGSSLVPAMTTRAGSSLLAGGLPAEVPLASALLAVIRSFGTHPRQRFDDRVVIDIAGVDQ
jgi:hypothetical protein